MSDTTDLQVHADSCPHCSEWATTAAKLLLVAAERIERLQVDNEHYRMDEEDRERAIESQAELVAEIERLKADNAKLRTARDELAYVVNYFQGGIRPTDLNEWWQRACRALEEGSQC